MNASIEKMASESAWLSSIEFLGWRLHVGVIVRALVVDGQSHVGLFETVVVTGITILKESTIGRARSR